MVLTTGPVIGTDLAPPWAVVAVATLLPPTTTTTTAAVLLAVTALAGMTTAAAPRRANFMTDVMEDMVARRLVAAWGLMSMAHRVRATLMILTMPGPAHHLVATMTPT